MSGETTTPTVLLIDDDPEHLERLCQEILKAADDGLVEVTPWCPSDGDVIRDRLVKELSKRPSLVVTDHDLTTRGAAGLLGGSIISSCRAAAIPVGDYSRLLADDLEQPDLFEFRFLPDVGEAARQIVNLVYGFRNLDQALANVDTDDIDSWSRSLAESLGKDDVASSFSLYSARTGSSHVQVIARLEASLKEDEAKRVLQTYVIGHLLANGILRYPGPILNNMALCSYLAVSDADASAVADLFEEARYRGPFWSFDKYFWHGDVEDKLVRMSEEREQDVDLDDDVARRELVQSFLNIDLHECGRCAGHRGGFRCPYTDRTVCSRNDCSVASSSWVPGGAYLTRVERDYFERYAPLLGL